MSSAGTVGTIAMESLVEGESEESESKKAISTTTQATAPEIVSSLQPEVISPPTMSSAGTVGTIVMERLVEDESEELESKKAMSTTSQETAPEIVSSLQLEVISEGINDSFGLLSMRRKGRW
ncbi:hypothetical protein AB1Y20_000219 [Prymnesium parvum]|uniref:Uncharacterized protein n=1 Tax=Prymnesium parvum TaxID=97485 RepID=A0AB34K5A5_PRYPA